AARMQCSNNLKQISLAVHNFESTYAKVPAMSVALGNGTGVRGSIMVALMPYVEQENLYRLHMAANGVTQAVAQNVVRTFICPSDPYAGTGLGSSTLGTVAGSFAVTDYNANSALFCSPNTSSFPQDATWNWQLPRFQTLVTIPDGTSNTVGFTERIVNAEGVIVVRDVAPESAADVYRWGAPVFGNYQSQYPGGGWGTWPFATPQVGQVRNLIRWRPSSAHTGTILVALMDGSVRGVSASITADTWWRACRPDDGAVLANDW
ncbi:MAG: DUF1559 domain-containing protein, partial [Gemmataceae bacterium]